MLTGLEEDLGLKLLIRDRSGVRLTEEGSALLPAVEAVCRANQALLQQVSHIHGLETGTIRIGSFLRFSVHLLPDLIALFSEQYPNIKFEVLQGSYKEIERWISEERVDCGFTRLPLNLPHLHHSMLLEERVLAVFPEGSAPAEHRVTLDELLDDSFILSSDAPDYADGSLLSRNSANASIHNADKDDYTVLAMVEKGLGTSLLPELLLTGRMHRLQSRECAPLLRQTIAVIHKNLQTLSPAAKHFVYLTRDYFAPASDYE